MSSLVLSIVCSREISNTVSIVLDYQFCSDALFCVILLPRVIYARTLTPPFAARRQYFTTKLSYTGTCSAHSLECSEARSPAIVYPSRYCHRGCSGRWLARLWDLELAMTQPTRRTDTVTCLDLAKRILCPEGCHRRRIVIDASSCARWLRVYAPVVAVTGFEAVEVAPR